MGEIKFSRPKQKIKVSANRSGLKSDNRVVLSGKRKKDSDDVDKIANSLERLRRQNEGQSAAGSSYPDFTRIGNKKSRVAKLARIPKRRDRSPSLSSSSGGSSFPSLDDDESDSDDSLMRKKPLAPPPKPKRLKMPPPVSDSDDDDSDEGSSDEDVTDDSDDDDSLSFSDSSSMASSALSSVEARKQRPFPVDKGLKGAMKGGAGGKTGISSTEAEEAEKNDLLARFHILRQRGVTLSKNFTNKSSLHEMRMEMGRIEHENQVARAVRMNRRLCLMGSSALTRLTDKYGPRITRGRWHGFDKHMLSNIQDFDEPFERLSESYGGVVSAISGGNPLWEIIWLFLYQFVSYGVMENGGEQARVNEDMTGDEIMKRYPNLVRQAVEKELRRRENEEMEERMRQQRESYYSNYAHYQPRQQQQQQPYAPPPMAAPPMPPMPNPMPQSLPRFQPQPVEPPSFDLSNLLRPRQQQQQQPQQQQQQQQQQQPVLHQEQPVFGSHGEPRDIMAEPPRTDPFVFADMHQALPTVDPREYGHEEMGGAQYDEDFDDQGYEEEEDDGLGIAQSTRSGSLSARNPPPNKRDNQSPFGSLKTGPMQPQEEIGGDEQLVVNIE